MNSRQIFARASRVLWDSRASGKSVRNSSYYKPAKTWKPPHLDEMPVPQGSWKVQHDAGQTKANIHLAIGITMFIGTVTFIKTSGIIFFNAFPPPLPEEECE